MSYKRADIDLTNCDREPIHIPGSIQPHGAMLVVDPDNNSVSHFSSNIDDYLGGNEDVVGKSLSDVVGSDVAHQIANTSARVGSGHVAGVLLNAAVPGGRRPTDITIHRYDGRLLVEFEPSASAGDAEIALSLTQSLVRRIDREIEVDDMVKTVARLIRAMLGYDRVMVYRFLHNGAGRVVAEAKDNGLQSFLGQHFPFSDIPVQARKLYLKNWIRVIGDVNFEPVPLMPAMQDADTPIDLSFAHLRSVSPIHCEYLKNMGVAASMSISIVVGGELWGLIACHHNSPKMLSIPLRVATELFAQYFSLHLSAAETRDQHAAAKHARAKLDAITATIDIGNDIDKSLKERLREFSALMDCDGAAIWSRNAWSVTGNVPDEAHRAALVDHLHAHAGGAVWETNNLKEIFPDADGYGSEVAGVIAVPISASNDSSLMFFRSEEAHSVEWAGEPVKQIVSGPSGDRLTPRGSFEAWREEVRHRSTPWSKDDIAVADSIRHYIRDVLLQHSDQTEERRSRTEQQRSILNAELNHRVKNILALVKSIATQTGSNATSVDDFAKSFDGRLRALSYAHDQSFAGKDGGELRALLEAEAAMHRFADQNRIVIDGPPIGLTERAFGVFALVMHEMMTNAAKYGSLSVASGRLEVRWTPLPNGDCRVTWIESDGPRVKVPTRRGFGSTLIERTVQFDLGGTAEMEFAEAGLRADFVIPREHHHGVAARQSQAAPQTAIGQPLDGMQVMLVEDQALIALDTEEILRELGAADVRSLPNVSLALQALSESLPNCAVLDLNLGKETSEAVAADLYERGIPFIFATGYRDSVSIPEQFATIPVVRKPISVDALAQQLSVAITSQLPGD